MWSYFLSIPVSQPRLFLLINFQIKKIPNGGCLAGSEKCTTLDLGVVSLSPV